MIFIVIPNVMYGGCYVCANLKCLGVKCRIGAPRYTMLVFGFPFLRVLARIKIKKKIMRLYNYVLLPLLQLYTATSTIP